MNTGFLNKVLAGSLLSALVLPAATVSAEETSGLQIGVLQCKVVPGSRVNLLIRSTADVDCTWEYAGATERYKGETGIALGLDLSFKDNESIAFGVIAASSDIAPGNYALEGKYVGGQASVAAGVGLGAKVLVGGGAKNVSLQPLALETSTGLGASAGVGFLYIERAQ